MFTVLKILQEKQVAGWDSANTQVFYLALCETPPLRFHFLKNKH